jgi:parallel beta-helix repeat protein
LENTDGIFICCQSESNVIDNNNAYFNDNGIRITSTVKTTITDNICSHNSNGISIGIAAKSTTLASNTMFSNDVNGIYLNKCEGISIKDNMISQNHNYGAYLDEVDDPVIYSNNFIKNTHHAYDNKPHQWNVSKTRGGNFYSGFESIDNNGDGFFDDQYPFAGPGKAIDNLPLVTSTNIQLKIITRDVQTVYINELFSVEYSVIYLDDYTDKLTWSLKTNAQWLTFSPDNVLYGTPEISDYGSYWINVSVSDGIDSDFNNFTLNVLTKISPKITTTNDLIAYVDESYSINYSASDPDTPQGKLIWSMDTNATWLKFSSTQELFGTPSYSDLGYYWVSIEVSDGFSDDLINFMIRVWMTKEQMEEKNKIPEIKETSIVKNSKNILIDTPDIEISFSKTMNISSIEENLKIIPDTNYSINWESENAKLRIIFNEKLEYITTYQISIRDGGVDLHGNNLEETFTLTFTTVNKQKSEGLEKQNENIRILSYLGALIIVLLLIYFIFIIKNRRKQREKMIEKTTEPKGRLEYRSTRIIEEYPYKDVAIGNAEEYMKHLINEALEFKKPSVFKTSNDKMWSDAKLKYQEGTISKTTLDSIKEELGIEEYPYEDVSIGNSEEYMRILFDEALEFKKPSEFKTSEEQMLKDAEEKFKNGKLSGSTFESIKETLAKIEKSNLGPKFDS